MICETCKTAMIELEETYSEADTRLYGCPACNEVKRHPKETERKTSDSGDKVVEQVVWFDTFYHD